MTQDIGGTLSVRARWSADKSDSLIWFDKDIKIVDVKLSGSRLADVLQMLWYLPNERRGWNRPDGSVGSSWANITQVDSQKAKRIYDAIAPVIDRVETNSPRQTDIPTIVIDDAIGSNA
jgi:hypothetical protein